jgi:hypothetical protein
MNLKDEVIIWYIKGNDQEGELGKVVGYIVDESRFLYTVAEVKRKTMVGKRSIIKIEPLEKQLKRDVDFLDI